MASLEMNAAALPRTDAETRHPSLLEWLFALGALSVFQGSFLPTLRSLAGGDTSAGITDAARNGDPLSRYTQLGILVILLTICVARLRQMLPLLKSVWPLGLFVLLCMASSLWSDRPFVVFRKSVALMSCLLFGVYLYQSFGPRRFLMVLTVSGGIASLASILLYAVSPSLASDLDYLTNGALRGVYSSKNSMSIADSLGLCAALTLLLIERGLTAGQRLFFSSLTGFMLLTLALSHGVSSIVNFLVVSSVLLTFSLRGASGIRIVVGYVLASAALFALFFIVFDAADVLSLVDKDTTLTGRVPLWEECLRAIAQRPLLGYGYMGFWDLDSVRTQYIWQRIGWQAEHAHNAYLELVLELGLLGAALYLAIFADIAIRALRYLKLGLAGVYWLVGFVVTLLIMNLDEGTFALPDEITVQLAFGACLVQAVRLGRYRRPC